MLEGQETNRKWGLHTLQACLDSLPGHWRWKEILPQAQHLLLHFCACDFYVGCKQRRWPHESPPHSSIHPSNDSHSHLVFLLTSLALCHPVQFFYEGKVRLGLMRGGWAKSMKYIKVPQGLRQMHEDSVSQIFHGMLFPFSLSCIHMYTYSHPRVHIFIYATTPHPLTLICSWKQACQASEFQRAVTCISLF